MNTKTSNKRIDWIYIVMFILALVLSFFITNKKAFASQEKPSDIIKKFGFTDSQILNKDDYEYHFIFSHPSRTKHIMHVYSNVPIKIKYQYHFVNGHCLLPSSKNVNIVQYRIDTKTYYEISEYESYFFTFNTKEEIVNHNYVPSDYNLNSYPLNYIYHISGSVGVQVSDNSLEDLGYSKNSIFFFQGTFAPGDDVSPLVPSESTPIDDGGLSDDDKSWFSGLFGGITQGLENVKNAILSGVTSAFEAVGQAIINGIKAIFIPDSEFLTEKIDSVKEKFAFIDNIKDAFDNVSSLVTDGNETVPVMTVDLSQAEGKYNYGTSACALDMNWYSRFKPYADGIIIAFAYISFIFLVFKRAPEIIKGSGAITKGID